MIIDTHQHFWKYDPVRDAWIDDSMALLKRDFLPEELKGTLSANAVDGCISVQAGQSEAETLFLLELAEQYGFIKGVVGWVDLRSGDVEERLEYFSRFPKLKGFRHIVQAEPDVNFMLRKPFMQGIGLLEKYGFTYDILIFPHQLGAALELARSFPRQRFVIDHLAKPYIRDGFFGGWAVLMAELGKLDNVWCKLSGMVTEADWQYWTPEDFRPYLAHVFESFGAGRLMYGSDWPVCLLGGSYKAVEGILEEHLQGFSGDEKDKIWGDNAVEFYDLSL